MDETPEVISCYSRPPKPLYPTTVVQAPGTYNVKAQIEFEKNWKPDMTTEEMRVIRKLNMGW